MDPVIYSTFVGGKVYERGNSIVLDSSNNAYITGMTESSDFPTPPGAYDTRFNGWNEIFVFKLSSDGCSLIYSTYVGGDLWEGGFSIAVDSSKLPISLELIPDRICIYHLPCYSLLL